MDNELRDQVKRLADRTEIDDCLQRYARGIDRQDRALLRSAYHDGAVDDHVGFVSDVDDFIDWAFGYHSNQTRYQHYPLNHTVDLDGETYYLFIGTNREPANRNRCSPRKPSQPCRGREPPATTRRIPRMIDRLRHRA